MWRLCVDPGLHSAGASLFYNQNVVRTTRITPDRAIADPMGARCLDVAGKILSWLMLTIPGQPVELIFEWPQHYDARKGKAKGNPNNLTPLAGIGCALAGRLVATQWLAGDPVTPYPSEWIGQLPKRCPLCEANKASCKLCKGSAWKTPRGDLIRNTLLPTELVIVPDQNDIIDSVGIGLWRVGRLNLRAQFPGLVTS